MFTKVIHVYVNNCNTFFSPNIPLLVGSLIHFTQNQVNATITAPHEHTVITTTWQTLQQRISVHDLVALIPD